MPVSPTCIFIKKETPAQVFSREFGETFKNNFSAEHLQTTASAHTDYFKNKGIILIEPKCVNCLLFSSLKNELF